MTADKSELLFILTELGKWRRFRGIKLAADRAPPVTQAHVDGLCLQPSNHDGVVDLHSVVVFVHLDYQLFSLFFGLLRFCAIVHGFADFGRGCAWTGMLEVGNLGFALAQLSLELTLRFEELLDDLAVFFGLLLSFLGSRIRYVLFGDGICAKPFLLRQILRHSGDLVLHIAGAVFQDALGRCELFVVSAQDLDLHLICINALSACSFSVGQLFLKFSYLALCILKLSLGDRCPRRKCDF